MINKVGELIDYVVEAVKEHGCKPTTDVVVRIGTLGPTYRISGMKGQRDDEGFRLVLETQAFPEAN
jgi:hypothetical protein